MGYSDSLYYASHGIPHANNYTESNFGNVPGDRRMIGGSGPGYLYAGDTLELNMAYIISFGTSTDTLGPSVTKLFSDAEKIKSYYYNNHLACDNNFDLLALNLLTNQSEIKVYPNPFENEFNVEHHLPGKVNLSIYNIQGQEVYSKQNIKRHEIISDKLKNGIYIIRLNNELGDTRVFKMLKQ